MDRSWYLLPNSPALRRLDRFSVLDDDEEGDDGLVSVWRVLEQLLQPPVKSTEQLIGLLDTISNVIRGSSGDAGDYGTLRGMVDKHSPSFFVDIWPKVAYYSLQLPTCFPDGKLPRLQPGSKLCLSKVQVASLVAHQFLCTLDCPEGRDGYFDFSIWYSSSQRHPYAAEMYIEALFTYFTKLELTDQKVTTPTAAEVIYSLHDYHRTSTQPLGTAHVRLQPISVQIVECYDTQLQELSSQGQGGAVVISANKDIGFGQSATQEEIYMGNCPEAGPAVLVTPTLQATHTLTVEGASPMLYITGQRRNVKWEPLASERRAGGRLLFMDALEIDELDDESGLPDVQPENIQREVRKAYTAFSSWTSGDLATVYAGIWGCGAFNGDPGIKMVILWIAASLAGRRLTVVCDDSHGSFPTELRDLIAQVPSSWTVQDLESLLARVSRDTKRLETTRAMFSLL
jgi:poly(ADP-ribose) glycohydrolase